MNYTKPEVAELGTAVGVIESIPVVTKLSTSFDGQLPPKNRPNPAYDLDE